MKHLLCEAFCAALEVRSVPVGWAVQTPFTNSDGDPLVVYLVRDADKGWRVEDDSTQVPMLEACGVDLGRKSRGDVFEYLLKAHEAHFDQDERTLHTAWLSEAELGFAAVRFAGLLLRLQDIALLSTPYVRNAFREDAIAAINQAFGGRARIEDRGLLSSEVIGPEADLVVRAASRAPLAIYIGTSEERALHALVSKMDAQAYHRIDCKVALVVERAKKNPLKENTLALAYARLDSVLAYRGVELDTIGRLAELAGLSPALEAVQ